MFSFHKPKIYRSNLGCCICKAKSSSSRFTDSKKYENEFERCFRINEKRSGEICNACVLLVKRWKKLSPENRLIKHWHHVVDARAGPGTKPTGNRRLINPSQQHSYHAQSGSSSSHSESTIHTQNGSHSGSNRATDSLPSSLSQSNSQASTSQQSGGGGTGAGRRSNSFSCNKARAIDTNVSTFTFGEPLNRRNYATTEISYASYPYSSSSSTFFKPQSALNSSAFESVIKRFKQRKQQEEIEANRRRLAREGRALKNSNRTNAKKLSQAVDDISPIKGDLGPDPASVSPNECGSQSSNFPSKRMKRSSESFGSLSIDGVRISSLLDGALWRKEKICCGVIFRGLNNEVAIFPKLLNACEFQLALHHKKTSSQNDHSVNSATNQSPIKDVEPMEPLPRTEKSGSISSCDSSTSGTGSMDQPIDERIAAAAVACKRNAPVGRPIRIQVPKQRGRFNLRRSGSIKSSGPTDTDSISSSGDSVVFSSKSGENSTEGHQVSSPGASSSSCGSSSRLLLMAEDDEAGELIIMTGTGVVGDDVESSTDASSSVESMTEVTSKKATINATVDTMG